MAVARVHVHSWQVAYRNLLPNDYLDQLRPEDRAARYDFAGVDPQKPHTIVAVEAGLIQGFATTPNPTCHLNAFSCSSEKAGVGGSTPSLATMF
jgi:hypothetical protein